MTETTLIGVDGGGTFTDLARVDEATMGSGGDVSSSSSRGQRSRESFSASSGRGGGDPAAGGRGFSAAPRAGEMEPDDLPPADALWHWLLERFVSEYGRLRHGDGGPRGVIAAGGC